jgi:hypothetical protein
MWGTVAKAPDRGSPGFQYKPLRAAARREALPVRRNILCSLCPLAMCAVLILVSRCTKRASVATGSATVGHVHGQLVFVRGPPPGSARPLSGTVTLSGQAQMNVTVGLGGHYFAPLPPGVYRGPRWCTAMPPIHAA